MTPKPWYKRSTFWTCNLFAIGAACASLAGVLPAAVAAPVAAVGVAAYAIARGLKGAFRDKAK